MDIFDINTIYRILIIIIISSSPSDTTSCIKTCTSAPEHTNVHSVGLQCGCGGGKVTEGTSQTGCFCGAGHAFVCDWGYDGGGGTELQDGAEGGEKSPSSFGLSGLYEWSPVGVCVCVLQQSNPPPPLSRLVLFPLTLPHVTSWFRWFASQVVVGPASSSEVETKKKKKSDIRTKIWI